MTQDPATQCTAFQGTRMLARGPLHRIARDTADTEGLLVFEDRSGRVIDIDPRGYPQPEAPTPEAPAEAPKKRGPGRPKLGVIPREITLLARHWEWLSQQKGGASATLRRLVDEARRADGGATEARQAHEAAYRFIHALGGDLAGYEDATRALFAGDLEAFATQMQDWPEDIRRYALSLSKGETLSEAQA
ncbi:DUF2239 family protein [Pararhodobacter oceanensis]|uniref:DUF2239 family protein n=1 Tax=Pararhodobacter oceanensis TaxID=2172121 RepID=UPI003A91EF89